MKQNRKGFVRTINDEDRRQWVLNDEGLYDMQQRSRKSLKRFIREERCTIDTVIRRVLDGDKPAHYLKYDTYRSQP